MTDIIGAKIVAVRSLTDDELNREGWLETVHREAIEAAAVIVFDNGMTIFGSQNKYGDWPGALLAHLPGEAESVWLGPEPGDE